jgi:hypothetical protein
MQEQSHDGGALFEFELQQRTDRGLRSSITERDTPTGF